ncbi:PcfJ domain-containing protein [Enterococcus thailandicus]|uniref:PcfJ domain-containing protein n=1 Tax=Enterococcus thailandicus TaxID=417368 RepID=UPI0035DDA0A0
MNSINLKNLFEDISHHFQQFSVEENDDLMNLLKVEKEENSLTFICFEGKIINPSESKMILNLRRIKRYIWKNKEFISEMKFPQSENIEYLVRVNFSRKRKQNEIDYGTLHSGSEYDCLVFNKLTFTSMGYITELDREPFYIHYTFNRHTFLEGQASGFTILNQRSHKTFKLSYEETLTFMDRSCKRIFQKVNPFINEMMREKETLPIAWSEIIEANNKYELLCKKYPSKSFTKKVNKYPLRISYALIKIKPRVTTNQFRKIEAAIEQGNKNLFPSKLFVMQHKNSREFVAELLISYVKSCVIKNVSSTYLRDLIVMSFELKKKLAFNFTSSKGLIRQHNQVVNEYNLSQGRKLKSFKLKQFDKYKPLINSLKENNHFTMIQTNKELFFEGENMHHCVYSYLGKVQKGGSTIWKYERGEHRYTLEIIKKRKGNYCVVQCYGKYDASPDENELERIKKVIEVIPFKNKVTIN